jgi:hypothetical protein
VAAPEISPCGPFFPPGDFLRSQSLRLFSASTPGAKKRRVDFFATHKKEDDSSVRRVADHLFSQGILTGVFRFGTLQQDSALDEPQGREQA